MKLKLGIDIKLKFGIGIKLNFGKIRYQYSTTNMNQIKPTPYLKA